MLDANKLKFLTEKYERENRNVRIQEEFIALPGKKPITSKFFTEHDALSDDRTNYDFVNLVKKWTWATPKDQYDFPPPSVNMEYGWFAEPLIPRLADRRLNFPIKQCDFIKAEIYIKEMRKKVPENKISRNTPQNVI